jgi:hypothetical protein
MPADLVTGKDLDDVASYIGTVAGNPEFKGPELPNDPGALVFSQNNCAGCHTLEAAGASGTVGPDLDDVLPGQTAAMIMQSIVKPEAKRTPGYPTGVMPNTFGQSISSQPLDQLVQFLLKCSGKGAKTPACQPTSGGSSGSGGSSSAGGSSSGGGSSKSGSGGSSKSSKSGSGGSSNSGNSSKSGSGGSHGG